jgi:hypothetical protein
VEHENRRRSADREPEDRPVGAEGEHERWKRDGSREGGERGVPADQEDRDPDARGREGGERRESEGRAPRRSHDFPPAREPEEERPPVADEGGNAGEDADELAAHVQPHERGGGALRDVESRDGQAPAQSEMPPDVRGADVPAADPADVEALADEGQPVAPRHAPEQVPQDDRQDLPHNRRPVGHTGRATYATHMWMRTLAHLLCAVALVLALAACGGEDGDVGATLLEGAEFAPATVSAFVELDTDADGAQWEKAASLLERFPGRGEVLEDIRQEWEREGLTWERDVRPALGDAVYAVWLDLERDGENVVGFAKPGDRGKFERLLSSGDEETVYREVDGWFVFAETRALLDRFQQARSGDALADQNRFEEAMDRLPEDAVARGFLNGDDVQRQLDESLVEEGVAPELIRKYGRLETLAAAVVAQNAGVLLKADVATESAADAEPYSSQLPSAVPAGAIAYVSFGDLEEGIRRGLRVLEENDRDVALQREQAEAALGFSLEDDFAPIFGGEGGVAVYRAVPDPGIALVLAVDDEDKARRTVDRLGALAQLGGIATTRRLTIEGVAVRRIRLPEHSLFAAVSRGRLVVTNSGAVLRDTLDRGPTLAGDDAFTRAADAAELPQETTGFVYLDLVRGVPFALDYAEREGEPVPPEVRRNVRPLEALVLWGDRRGEDRTLTGFLKIGE